MTEKLKPCPFCGGEAKIVDYSLKSNDELFAVICTNNNCLVQPETPYYVGKGEAIEAWNKCYLISPLKPTREEAIKAWNRRVSDA